MTKGVYTWADLWAMAVERLGDSDSARHIIEHASGKSGASWLLLNDAQAPLGAVERVEQMVKRCEAGEPVQYVLGEWDFRNLELRIDQRVLIPRPETEQVVEAALDALRGIEGPLIVDLGTGSGAIALSIAQEVADSQVIATDASEGALEVARRNEESIATQVGGRVRFVCGDWYQALPEAVKGDIDLVISNPPYIADRAKIEERVSAWEPHDALFSGSDGLDDIRVITSEAPQWLKKGGKLVIELSPEQSNEAASLAMAAGFTRVEIGKDFAGRDRWLLAFNG